MPDLKPLRPEQLERLAGMFGCHWVEYTDAFYLCERIGDDDYSYTESHKITHDDIARVVEGLSEEQKIKYYHVLSPNVLPEPGNAFYTDTDVDDLDAIHIPPIDVCLHALAAALEGGEG